MKKLLSLLLVVSICLTGCSKKEETIEEVTEPIIVEEKEVSIIDIDSITRPYAVVINNSTYAVKVQTGLQQAYLVYEFPVEGGLTRLMALYKDISDLTIGTIRSARHNFLDYAFEHDAIFVCFGWSHYAEDDMKSTGINYLNGVVHSGPFWRENPEGLAVEHTAYTSASRIKENSTNRNYNLTTTQGLVLNYSAEEIDLTGKDNNIVANVVSIPAGAETTRYEYDIEKENYKRFVNGNANVDYNSKEQFTTKNIIVQKINTKMASDNYYWDLETVGSGDGYYITNGVSVPIKWSKSSRKEKTKYTYLNGEEVVLNDGNTFIQLQSNNQKLTIE